MIKEMLNNTKFLNSAGVAGVLTLLFIATEATKHADDASKKAQDLSVSLTFLTFVASVGIRAANFFCETNGENAPALVVNLKRTSSVALCCLTPLIVAAYAPDRCKAVVNKVPVVGQYIASLIDGVLSTIGFPTTKASGLGKSS